MVNRLNCPCCRGHLNQTAERTVAHWHDVLFVCPVCAARFAHCVDTLRNPPPIKALPHRIGVRPTPGYAREYTGYRLPLAA